MQFAFLIVFAIALQIKAESEVKGGSGKRTVRSIKERPLTEWKPPHFLPEGASVRSFPCLTASDKKGF